MKSDAPKVPYDWSRDGRFIFYETFGEGTKSDLWMLPLEGDRTPRPLLQSASNERQGRLSPDGQWLAYYSDESGKNEVYVQTFPPSGGKWQVSISGGTGPRWRRDGREVYYISADRKLMAVEVKAGRSFESGVPKPLMQLRPDTGTDPGSGYAVTSDGQRFLINSTIVEPSPSPITVVLNWTAELKR